MCSTKDSVSTGQESTVDFKPSFKNKGFGWLLTMEDGLASHTTVLALSLILSLPPESV